MYDITLPDDKLGWVVTSDYYSQPGDSGGIVYIKSAFDPPLNTYYLTALGIHVGQIPCQDENGNEVNFTVFAPAYNITNYFDLEIYTSG